MMVWGLRALWWDESMGRQSGGVLLLGPFFIEKDGPPKSWLATFRGVWTDMPNVRTDYGRRNLPISEILLLVLR